MTQLPRLQFCAGVNPNLPVSREIVKTALALAQAKRDQPRPEPTAEMREQMAIRRGHRRTALLVLTRRLAARGLAQSETVAAAAAAAATGDDDADADADADDDADADSDVDAAVDADVNAAANAAVNADDEDDDDPYSDDDIDAVLDMARAVINEGVHHVMRHHQTQNRHAAPPLPSTGTAALPPWLRASEKMYMDMLKSEPDACADPDLALVSSSASAEPCSGVVVRRILQAPGDAVPIQIVPGDGDPTKNFENCRSYIEKQPKTCKATLVRGFKLSEQDWPGSGDGLATAPAFFVKATFHCVVRVTKMNSNTGKEFDSHVCVTSSALDVKTGRFDDCPFIFVPSSRAHAELTDAQLLSSRWSCGIVVIGDTDAQSKALSDEFQRMSTVLAENVGLSKIEPSPIASRESVVRTLLEAMRKRECDEHYDTVFEQKLHELEARGSEPIGMTPESIHAVPNLTVLLHPLFDAWHKQRRFKMPNWKLAAHLGFPTVSRVREFVVTRLIEFLIDKIKQSHAERERPGNMAELHETMRWLDRQVDDLLGMVAKKVECENLWSPPYSDKNTMPAYKHTLALYIANAMGFDNRFCQEQAFGVLDALYKSKIADLPKQKGRKKKRSSSRA